HRPDPRPGDRGGAAAGAGPARTVRETPVMNLPAAIYAVRWLVRDTFRQALASRIFWVMLAVSGLCILACLSVRIQDDVSLHRSAAPSRRCSFPARTRRPPWRNSRAWTSSAAG